VPLGPQLGPNTLTEAIERRAVAPLSRDRRCGSKTHIEDAWIAAARPLAIRRPCLDDVDLGNRRLTIDQHVRPLDELTRRAVPHWLDYRRTAWPTTPNGHLLITAQTAITTAPVSQAWLTDTLSSVHTSLEQLRIDRQLEEALTHRADPLHLATVFGIDQRTALRYAESARQLLTTTAERDVGC
jgi:hypothetical protein